MNRSQSRHNIISQLNHDKIQEAPVSIIGSTALSKRDSTKSELMGSRKEMDGVQRKSLASSELSSLLKGRTSKILNAKKPVVDEEALERVSVHAIKNEAELEHYMNDDDEYYHEKDPYDPRNSDLSKFNSFLSSSQDNVRRNIVSPIVAPVNTITQEDFGSPSSVYDSPPMRSKASPSFISVPRPRLKSLLDVAASIQPDEDHESSHSTLPSVQSRRNMSFVYVPKPSLTDLLEAVPKPKPINESRNIKSPSTPLTTSRPESASKSGSQQQVLPKSATPVQKSPNFEMYDYIDKTIEKWCGLTPPEVPIPQAETLDALSHNDVFSKDPEQKRLVNKQNMPLRLKSRDSPLYTPENEAVRRQQQPTGTHYAKGDMENTNVGTGGVSTYKSVRDAQHKVNKGIENFLAQSAKNPITDDSTYLGLEYLGATSPEQYYLHQQKLEEQKVAKQLRIEARAAEQEQLQKEKEAEATAPRRSFLLPSSLFTKEQNVKNSQKRKLEESKQLSAKNAESPTQTNGEQPSVLRRASSLLSNALSLPALSSPNSGNADHNKSMPIFNRLSMLTGSGSGIKFRSSTPSRNDDDYGQDNNVDDEDENDDDIDKDEAELQDEFPTNNNDLNISRSRSPSTGRRSPNQMRSLQQHSGRPSSGDQRNYKSAQSSTKTATGSGKGQAQEEDPDYVHVAFSTSKSSSRNLRNNASPINSASSSFHNPYSQLGVDYDRSMSNDYQHDDNRGNSQRPDSSHSYQGQSAATERHARAMKESTTGQTNDSPVLYAAPSGVYSKMLARSASPSSPASSHYSSTVMSGVSASNLAQHLEIGGKQVFYSPTNNSSMDRDLARQQFAANAAHGRRKQSGLDRTGHGHGSGISSSSRDRDLMGVSAYDWDMHAFRVANASAAELVTITSDINSLLQCNSQNSIEVREKAAISALERKLAQRYAATKEDDYQETMRQKAEESKNEKLNHDVMRGYLSEMSGW
jgi:hypothetical protein